MVHCSGKSNTVADCLTRVDVIEPLIGEELISEEEIVEEQLYDQEAQFLIQAINFNYRRRPELCSEAALRVENGILKSKIGQIYVPLSKRDRILNIAHAAHLGYQQTYRNISSKFLFPKLKTAVINLVSKCRVCSLVKPKFRSPHACSIITKAPMEVLALDFVGPLPPMSRGKKYLLVTIE